MKKLFVMLAFLFLSWTGYGVDIQCSNGSNAEIEPRTIYICLVISKMGTEVIATQVDGVYNAQAKLLQKSEMRKDIVIELSYKGFG